MVDDSQSKKYVIIIAICSNCNTQSKLEKKQRKSVRCTDRQCDKHWL